MRIRVIDVLDLFAAGLTSEQILEEMPDLETEDLKLRCNMQPASWIIRCLPHDDLGCAVT